MSVSYFRTFENRNEVKYFISDMNPHFRNVAAACFPKAKRIADKYHVTRMCMWAMENVRKKEQAKLSKKFRIYFKRSRQLMLKDPKDLTPEEMDRLLYLGHDDWKCRMRYCTVLTISRLLRTASSGFTLDIAIPLQL